MPRAIPRREVLDEPSRPAPRSSARSRLRFLSLHSAGGRVGGDRLPGLSSDLLGKHVQESRDRGGEMSDGITREPTMRPITDADILSDEAIQSILNTLEYPAKELLTRHMMATE